MGQIQHEQVRVSAGWDGLLTATSSIAHGGQARGTITLLRREQILLDGQVLQIPMISGNSWRGRLRRIGEELTREVLAYEGQLTPAAAHFLRGGGSLVKSSREPLSGARLRRARMLLPQLEVFGGASGRTFHSSLQVGKLIPHIAETAHLTGHPGPPGLSATQLESYTRLDEADRSQLHQLTPVPMTEDGQLDLEDLPARIDGTGAVVYRIETFPAGTVFSTWLRLEATSAIGYSFFRDVLRAFITRGRLGGRTAIGHGCFTASFTSTHTPGIDPLPDWRSHLRENHEEIMTLLKDL